MKDRLLPGSVLLGLLSMVLGCPSSGGGSADPSAQPAPPPSPSASARRSIKSPVQAMSANEFGIPIGVPFPAADIIKAVNPKGEAPYSGPTGTLKGTVRIEGDPPPATGLQIPSKCAEAAATYGKLFRVGLDKAVADTMVAVTEYSGFVPARADAAKITIHGCALARRTVVATYGQRIDVSNLDRVDPYMPYLDGAPTKSVLVAVPMGDPVKLYPQQPGHYAIRDQLPNAFLQADVFVLSYATHDVTGLDGRYEIKDIPVGHVKVNAYLPAIDKTVGKDFDIKAGENTLDLTLTFDKAKDVPGGASSAKPSASASAAAKAGAPPK